MLLLQDVTLAVLGQWNIYELRIVWNHEFSYLPYYLHVYRAIDNLHNDVLLGYLFDHRVCSFLQTYVISSSLFNLYEDCVYLKCIVNVEYKVNTAVTVFSY